MGTLFTTEKYKQRRSDLKEKVKSGLILIFGNQKSPMNYPSNGYPFRQDSNFLYFFGIDKPGLCGIIDIDSGQETILGIESTIDDLIWDGKIEKLEDMALKAGVENTLSINMLPDLIKKTSDSFRKIHYLPPYRGERILLLSELLNIPATLVKEQASTELIKAVISLRSIKDPDEILEMEDTLNLVTSKIFDKAIKMANQGTKESEIVAVAESIALTQNRRMAYPVICSINGQYLHNESYDNTLREGQLLLIDAGSESQMYYATDITRTYPVGKKFSTKQTEIYQLVLDMMQTAFANMKPGIPYQQVHKCVSKVLAEGMISLGLMKGNAEEIVNEGAHALFFPHGLGHLVGLDVHDMEDLGENLTGYDEKYARSNQFGTGFLRYGKELKQGLVITVEPGIYFIPALIDLWEKEGKYRNYINYSRVNDYKTFGGIRVEDNVLITEKGNRILGNPIPKSISEIEGLK